VNPLSNRRPSRTRLERVSAMSRSCEKGIIEVKKLKMASRGFFIFSQRFFRYYQVSLGQLNIFINKKKRIKQIKSRWCTYDDDMHDASCHPKIPFHYIFVSTIASFSFWGSPCQYWMVSLLPVSLFFPLLFFLLPLKW
jgi:hypothetical protein